MNDMVCKTVPYGVPAETPKRVPTATPSESLKSKPLNFPGIFKIKGTDSFHFSPEKTLVTARRRASNL